MTDTKRKKRADPDITGVTFEMKIFSQGSVDKKKSKKEDS